MDSADSPDRFAEVRSLIAAGNKVLAIKVYREITGVGLAEAKDAVEQMAAAGREAPQAGLPTNAPQKSGCFGMIAILTGILFLLIGGLL